MKQFRYLSVISIFWLTACTSDYKKSERGLEYKIIADGNGKKVAYGNFLQIQTKQIYGDPNMDTILFDSREIVPGIEPYDSTSYPGDLLKIFGQLRKGDSLVLRLSVDTIYGRNLRQRPSFVKDGGYMYTTIKVINKFNSQAQADSAFSAEIKIAKPKMFKKQLQEVEKILAKNKQQLEVDDKIISDYLAKNDISAARSNWGTYVAIHEEGTGDKIDNNSIVTINYSGKTLDSGKVFDSNIDPKFNHAVPLVVSTSQLSAVMFGMSDGMRQLRKGAKATFYIPSTLAFGLGGAPKKKIKPNENLIVDIEIINVTNEDTIATKSQKIQKNK